MKQKENLSGVIKSPKPISEQNIRILELEFNYAKETSIQAQDDRLTTLNFYLGLYAAVLTIALGFREIASSSNEKTVALFFVGLSFISIIFVFLQVRLRQAWLESARVMNKIKDYFIDRDAELEKYIVWRNKTLPRPEKFKTVSYLSSLAIISLGTISLCIGFLLIDLDRLMILLLASIYFIASWAIYYILLKFDK